MERQQKHFEYLHPDQQYEIAATVGILRTLPKVPLDLALGGAIYEARTSAAAQPPYEASFALLLELGAKDIALLEQYIIRECPRKYAQSNNTLTHCHQLQLVDSRGVMTENAELAFRYELRDEPIFNEIFTDSRMDRLEPLIDEVSAFAFEDRIVKMADRAPLSDLLLNYKGYLAYWIGEYDRYIAEGV